MAVNKVWARVTAAIPPVVVSGKNLDPTTPVTRNGVGDYTLNFKEDLVANNVNYIALAACVGSDTDLEHIDVQQVNDLSCRVRTNIAGVAAEIDFSVECWSDADTSARAQ